MCIIALMNENLNKKKIVNLSLRNVFFFSKSKIDVKSITYYDIVKLVCKTCTDGVFSQKI